MPREGQRDRAGHRRPLRLGERHPNLTLALAIIALIVLGLVFVAEQTWPL